MKRFISDEIEDWKNGDTMDKIFYSLIYVITILVIVLFFCGLYDQILLNSEIRNFNYR